MTRNSSVLATTGPLLLSPELNARTDKALWEELRALGGRRLEPSNAAHAVWIRRWNQLKRAVEAATGLSDGSALNTRVDQAFWEELRSKVGRRLDPSAAGDAIYRQRWHELRHEISQAPTPAAQNTVSTPGDANSLAQALGRIASQSPASAQSFEVPSALQIAQNPSKALGMLEFITKKIALVASASIFVIEKSATWLSKLPGASFLAKAAPFVPALRLVSGLSTLVNVGTHLGQAKIETLNEILPESWLSPPLRQAIEAAAWVGEVMAATGGMLQVFAGGAALLGMVPIAAPLAMAASAFSIASLLFNPAKILAPVLAIGRGVAQGARTAKSWAQTGWEWSKAKVGTGWNLTKDSVASKSKRWASNDYDEISQEMGQRAPLSRDVYLRRAQLWGNAAQVLDFSSTVAGVISLASSLVLGGAAVAAIATGGATLPVAALALKVQAISGLASTALAFGKLYAQKQAINYRVASANDDATKRAAIEEIEDYHVDLYSTLITESLGAVGDAKTLFKGFKAADLTGTTKVGASIRNIKPILANLRSGGVLRLKQFFDGFRGFKALSGLSKVAQLWEWISTLADWADTLSTLKDARKAVKELGEVGQSAWNLGKAGFVAAKAGVVNGTLKTLSFGKDLGQRATTATGSAFATGMNTLFPIRQVAQDGNLTGPFFPQNGVPVAGAVPDPVAAVRAGAVVFVNGILTDYAGHCEAAQELANQVKGPVVGVFNATALPETGKWWQKTAGFVRDVGQTITDKIGVFGMGGRNLAVQGLKKLILDVGSPTKKNGGLKLYAHSQGSIILSEALRELKAEGGDLSHLDVTTFGNAIWTMPTGVGKERHFVYDSDTVSAATGSTSKIGHLLTRLLPEGMLARMGKRSTADNTFMLHHAGAGLGPHGILAKEQSAVSYFRQLTKESSGENSFERQEERVRAARIAHGQAPDRISSQSHTALVKQAGEATTFAWGRLLGFKAAQAVGKGYNWLDHNLPQWMRQMPLGSPGGPSWQGLDPSFRRAGRGVMEAGTRIGQSQDRKFNQGAVLQRLGFGAHPQNDAGELRDSLLRQSRGFVPDGNIRSRLAPHLGFDPAGARFHNNATSAQAARALRAQAFTIGRDVFFAPNLYQPNTAPGMGLIAHELTHVGQQNRGPRRARFFTTSGGDGMENEAQTLGEQVRQASVNQMAWGTMSSNVPHIENFSSELSCDDEPLSEAEHTRLEALGARALSGAKGQLGLLDRSLDLESVECHLTLDLESGDDDQLVAHWTSALVAAVREAANRQRTSHFGDLVPTSAKGHVQRAADSSSALQCSVPEESWSSSKPNASSSKSDASKSASKPEAPFLDTVKSGLDWMKAGENVLQGTREGQHVPPAWGERGAAAGRAMKNGGVAVGRLMRTKTAETISALATKLKTPLSRLRDAIEQAMSPQGLQKIITRNAREEARRLLNLTGKEARRLWKSGNKEFLEQVQVLRESPEVWKQSALQALKKGKLRVRNAGRLLGLRNKLRPVSQLWGKARQLMAGAGQGLSAMGKNWGASIKGMGGTISKGAGRLLSVGKATLGKLGTGLSRAAGFSKGVLNWNVPGLSKISALNKIPLLKKIPLLSLLSIGADVHGAKPEDKNKTAFVSTSRELGSWGGGILGAKAGAAGGAAIGAGIGAFFGGIGAVPGAAIGGLIGGIGGALFGSDVGGQLGEGLGKGVWGGPKNAAAELKERQDAAKAPGFVPNWLKPSVRPIMGARQSLKDAGEFVGSGIHSLGGQAMEKAAEVGGKVRKGAGELLQDGRDLMKRSFAPKSESSPGLLDLLWSPDANRGWA